MAIFPQVRKSASPQVRKSAKFKFKKTSWTCYLGLILFTMHLGISSLGAQAIQSPPVSLWGQLDDAMSSLGTQHLETPLLIDKTPEALDFDSLRLGDTANISTFGQVYAMLYGAQMIVDTMLPEPGLAYNDKLDSLQAADPIPIGIIFRHYDTFKDSSEISDLIDIQNDVLVYTGSGETPYRKDSIWVAAPLVPVANAGQDTFIIDSDFIITDGTNTIDEVQVDFGSGYVTVPFDSAFVLQEGQVGDGYVINMKLLLNSGGEVNTVSVSKSTDYGDVVPDRTPDLRLTRSATEDNSGYLLEFFFNCEDKKLRKPLIVINGYDPPQKKQFGLDRQNGIMFFFLSATPFSNQPSKTLEDFIVENEYDIIWLTYGDGGAPLENLSRGVKDAIETVNGLKNSHGSDEGNVIVGVSHGGIAGKWALLDFEEKNEDHGTDLFINFDEGQRGGNFPLGVQHFIKHILNVQFDGDGTPLSDFLPLGIGKAVEDVFSARALRDLIEYSAWSEDGVNSLTKRDYFDNIEEKGINNDSRLHNLSYITISNGSLMGTPQQRNGGDIQAGDVMLSAEFKVLAALTDGLSGLFRGNYKGDFEIRYMPDNPTSNFMVYSSTLKRTFFGYTQWESNYEVPVVGTKPLDNAPGGFMGIEGGGLGLFGGLELGFGGWFSPISLNINLPSLGPFCITPAVSSVDLRDPEFEDLYYPLSNIDQLKSQGITRNHDFIGPLGSNFDDQENQMHPTLTELNMAYFLSWVLTENENLMSVGTLTGSDFFNFGTSRETFDYQNLNLQPRRTGLTLDKNATFKDQSRLLYNADEKLGMSTVQFAGDNELGKDQQYYIKKNACQDVEPTLIFEDQSRLEVNLDNTNANTTLYIDAGRVEFNDLSVANLHSGSEVRIRENGEMVFSDQSQLLMDADTRLVVESGGILELNGNLTASLSENAQIIVEDGGEIVLGGGVNLVFNDPDLLDDVTSLIVNGKLRLDGDVNIGGEGWIHLEKFSLIWDSNQSWWNGSNSQNKSLVVDEGTFEVPQNHLFSVSSMEVEFRNEGQIEVTKGGIRAEKSEFSSPDNTDGILIYDAGLIFLSECVFEGFSKAVFVDGYEYNSIIPGGALAIKTFSDLEFYDNSESLVLMNLSNRIYLRDISIHSTLGVGTGIMLENSRFYKLINCNMSNLQRGIELSESRYNILHGCLINDCDVGIYDSANGGSNVTLIEGTEIKDNTIGVELYGERYIDSNGDLQSSGLLMMDCAKIWDNGTGVKGEDILFMIDPNHIANSMGSQTKRPNEFSSVWGFNPNNIFEVDYFDRGQTLVQAVFARENYWGIYTPPDQSTGIPPRSLLRWPGPTSVPLIYNNFETSSLGYCPQRSISTMISVESPFELNSTFDDDGLWGLGNDPWFYTTNNNTSDSVHLLNVFNIGIQYFYLDSIDFAEDFMTYFVDELQYGQDSLVNHLIQIAEIFSDESPTGELMTQSLTAKTGTINIYPNPAWDQIQIQSDREISNIQVYDLQGRMFEERKFEVGVKNVRMPLYSWPPGQYFLRIQLINGEWVHQQIFKASK